MNHHIEEPVENSTCLEQKEEFTGTRLMPIVWSCQIKRVFCLNR